MLLADEPTGNLDSINAWDIIQLLLKINKNGTTVILATHAKDLVNSIKKRVVTIEKGEMVWVAYHTNPYGTEKVSYCKVCTIRGLRIRKRNIEALLKQIGEV